MNFPGLNRQGFLAAAAASLSAALFHRIFPSLPRADYDYIRPPGTEDEKIFLDRCIRCRMCGDVCEAGCIRFFSISDGIGLAGTPHLLPRLRACNLCTTCGRVCPTGALRPVKKEIGVIAKEVRMGIAKVIESNCLSFNGRVCGVCRDACPLKGKAIKLKPVAKPVVFEDACIGCGRCEERCPQYPAAIVVKREDLQHAEI